MMSSRYAKNKQGNMIIAVGLIVLVLIFAVTFLLYYQVNIITESIRQDLFYVSNSSLLSFNTSDLAYGKYTVDVNKTKKIMEYLLNKNYQNGSVKDIKITNLDVIYEQDKVRLDAEIKVKFKSVITIGGKNEHEFKMKEQVKIALLEYN